MNAGRFLSEKVINRITNIGFSIILLGGIALRLVYWLQNRNLFIDEANVVRNLYERSFAELLQPLSYEQYAAPVFLWVEKLFALLFGYEELVVRFFPLLCGIASLFVFSKLLCLFMSRKAAWYPLALFAFGMIYLYYSATVKQYMPDVLVSMLLVLFTKKLDVLKVKRWVFFTKWLVLGSLAIWSSMSAVFILAGIGFYYFVEIIKQKKYNNLIQLGLVLFSWLIQFSLYYYFILSAQIHSDYLQAFHAPYFLRFSLSFKDWAHNFSLLQGIFTKMSGHAFISQVIQFLLLAIGVLILVMKRKRELLLLVVPLLCVCVAAFINKYTLIPRTTMFLFPLLLILIGIGAEYLLAKTKDVVLIPLLVVTIITVVNFQTIPILWTFQGEEEICMGFDFVKSDVEGGKEVYLSHLAQPAYEYYTIINNNANNYSYMRNVESLRYDTDLKIFSATLTDTTYFIFTSGQGDKIETKYTKAIGKSMNLFTSFHKYHCHVYGYVPK